MYEQSSLLQKVLRLLTVGGVVLSIGYLAAAKFNYGTLAVELPKGGAMFINGVVVDGNQAKVRPGRATVRVVSPRYNPYEETVSVRAFTKKTLSPIYTERNPDHLVASVIGAYGTYGIPSMEMVSWSHDDTWFTAAIGPGSGGPFALHYKNNRWNVAYYQAIDQPTDLSSAPQDVVGQIETIRRTYAQ